MKSWLYRHEWKIIGSLAVTAFLLGVFGLRRHSIMGRRRLLCRTIVYL